MKECSYFEEKGIIYLNFKDLQAEEDFLRPLARNGNTGSVIWGDITTAHTRSGKLIDLRTNEAFPTGGHTLSRNLVQDGRVHMRP